MAGPLSFGAAFPRTSALDSINTNASALQALEALTATSKAVGQAENRVSTGLAIAGPQDNGAVWSIAQNMRGQASAWQTVANGLNRAQSIADVAASGASSITTILNSIKAEALSLKDTSLDPKSQADIIQNIQQLIGQIDQAANGASFDGVDLLVPITEPAVNLSFPAGGPNPSLSFSTPVDGRPGLINMSYSLYNTDPYAPNAPTLTTSGLSSNGAWDFGASATPGQTDDWETSFQYGDWNDFTVANPSSVGFSFSTSQFPTPAPPAPPPPAAYGVTVQSLTLTPFRTHETTPSTPDGDADDLVYHPMTSDWLGLSGLTSLPPDQMVTAVDSALAQTTANAGYFGTLQNLISTQIAQANSMQDSIATGVGELVDANMGKESANLQAEQVKQQLAAKSLSLANATPQVLLSLFR